ncbi:hypothetical protein ACHAWF_000913 [Thalassiosira exigua]
MARSLISASRRLRPTRGRAEAPEASPPPSALSAASSRALSSRSRKSSPPSKSASQTWERSAKLVKNTDVSNPYLDAVRSEVVDPALQLKTIEDELCGAIGKALGRQGEKVLFALREMDEARFECAEAIGRNSLEEASRSAARHNEARERAIKARWELLVHRQAVGFIVDNHRVVHETFPIGEALPVDAEAMRARMAAGGGDDAASSERPPPAETRWGDQLSWWQRVGRWK